MVTLDFPRTVRRISCGRSSGQFTFAIILGDFLSLQKKIRMVMMQLELCMTDSEKEQAFQQQAKQAEKQPTETADSEDSSKDGETA